MGTAIPLTVARGLNGRAPLSMVTRLDIDDYGPPGPHLGGPWAKTKAFIPPGFESLAPEGSAAAGVDGCSELGGQTITFSPQVAAVTTAVESSILFPRPFIITNVQALSSNAQGAAVALAFLVAEDINTTGGFATSGTFWDNGRGTRTIIAPSVVVQTAYPNIVVPFPNRSIKVVEDNQSGAAVEFDVIVSIKWLT